MVITARTIKWGMIALLLLLTLGLNWWLSTAKAADDMRVTVRTSRAYTDSWATIVAKKTQGFFLGKVVAKGEPVEVRHTIDRDEDIWRWTPYSFEIERVINPTAQQEVSGQIITIFIFADERNIRPHFEVENRIAIGLEWGPAIGIQPEGYFIWDPAIYDVSSDGLVNGGGDNISLSGLSLQKMIDLIQNAAKTAK